jgi:3-hydroxybutyryl-CoA dehydrogenase
VKIGVVGLGAMGSGIAQLALEANLETVGREVEPARGEAARERIAYFLGRKVDKGLLDASARDGALNRLRLTVDLGDLRDCDVVIEAAFEDLAVKQQLFRELERVVGPNTILATNTSALSVTEIASVLDRPARAVGMHFFNPAPLMPLVEIVRAERTDEAVVERAAGLAEQLGKRPIRCSDTPGFVVNRVLIPLLNDCVRVLDETGVTPEELDAGMTAGAGWPLGPCALLDLVGADVHVHASQALYEKLREPRMAPPPRLQRMATAGKLGRKTGEGFYRYDESG